MSNQKKWDKTFMDVAKLIQEHSTCHRLKVGSVLVKNNRILSIGYNGVPAGKKHCDDIFSGYDKDNIAFKNMHKDFSSREEFHSELNCIIACAKNSVSPVGTTLYVTISPCNDCSKLILISGIKRVIYLEKYDRCIEGIKFLKENNVIVEQLI